MGGERNTSKRGGGVRGLGRDPRLCDVTEPNAWEKQGEANNRKGSRKGEGKHRLIE